MDPVELRKAMGLPEDATDEQVMAKAAELAARPTEPAPTDTPPAPTAEVPAPTPTPTPKPTAAIPPGTVVVDEQQWAEVTRKAEEGALAASAMRKRDRDAFIAQVRGEGRLAASNAKLRETLEREWDRDPVAARDMANELARVVPTGEIGYDAGGGDEGTGDPTWDAFEASLSPDVAATRRERAERQRS